MKKVLLGIGLLMNSVLTHSQTISLTSISQVINENFNTLSVSGTAQSALPNGWWIAETGSSGNSTYRAGDGSTNTGDTYSFGTSTNSERAFGSIASGSVTSNFGVRIVNNTSSAITQFSYDLFMEQWRCGGRTDKDSLYFSYGINVGATSVYNRVASNDLISKTTVAAGTALDGNVSANRQYYTFSISNINWAVGDTLFIRWSDPNVGGNDDGLSIDDFNFTVAGVLPVLFKSFTSTRANNSNLLKWTTATETNNSGFEVQRSVNNGKYEVIGFVKGAGNSRQLRNYSFTDAAKLTGNVCYRLRQIDFNGNSELSKSACVNISEEKITTEVLPTPNPFNNSLQLNYATATEGNAHIEVVDMLGKVQLQTNEHVNKGANSIHLNTETLPLGIYFLRVSQGSEVLTKRIVKK